MIVDFKALIIQRERSQLAQKWKVLSRILERGQAGAITSISPDRDDTFCACCATIKTSEKSYIPRAVSKSLSASTRKITYFTASSVKSGCASVKKSL